MHPDMDGYGLSKENEQEQWLGNVYNESARQLADTCAVNYAGSGRLPDPLSGPSPGEHAGVAVAPVPVAVGQSSNNLCKEEVVEMLTQVKEELTNLVSNLLGAQGRNTTPAMHGDPARSKTDGSEGDPNSFLEGTRTMGVASRTQVNNKPSYGKGVPIPRDETKNGQWGEYYRRQPIQGPVGVVLCPDWRDVAGLRDRRDHSEIRKNSKRRKIG